MRLQDLRIGNYFVGYDNKILQVDTRFFAIIHAGAEVDELVKKFIPLTEEWLLKFGFRKVFNSYVLKGFEITFQEGVAVSYKNTELFEIINYPVHELQNLFLSINGEELN